MKHFLPSILVLLAAVPVSANASDTETIIANPPTGREVPVYADFRSEENVFGFVGDYHSIHKIVYTDDNKVYLPNVLLRKTMPGYVVGTLDPSANTVTVEAGQLLYRFPNINGVTRLYMLDAAGQAGDLQTGQFNTEPLVFDVEADGTLILRTSDKFPMFGVAGQGTTDDNTSIDLEVYGVGADLRFTPTELSTKATKYYTLDYINDKDDKEYSVTISGYADGENVWFKGFNPRYPNAWTKTTWVENELRAASFQLLNRSNAEIPTVMAASIRELNDNGDYVYTHAYTFAIKADKENDKYSAFTEQGWFFTNLTSYDEETADAYQAYRNLHLTPVEVKSAVPANPVFDGFDREATSKETEFKFKVDAVGTDGSALLKDALALRYYVNGEVYVFRKSVYTRLDSDMELVPFTFQDNNTFIIGSEKYYTYFLNSDLPADLKTMGVELIYTVDGITTTSQRLVYDVATHQASYEASGIAYVEASKPAVAKVAYFDLQGRPVAEHAKGLLIKVTTFDNGETETSKVIVK